MKLRSFHIGTRYSSVYFIYRAKPPFDLQDFFAEDVYTPEYNCLPSGAAIFSIHDAGGWNALVMLNEPVKLAADTMAAVHGDKRSRHFYWNRL